MHTLEKVGDATDMCTQEKVGDEITQAVSWGSGIKDKTPCRSSAHLLFLHVKPWASPHINQPRFATDMCTQEKVGDEITQTVSWGSVTHKVRYQTKHPFLPLSQHQEIDGPCHLTIDPGHTPLDFILWKNFEGYTSLVQC